MGSRTTRASKASFLDTLSTHRREIAFVSALLVGAFSMASLVGWSAADPSWLRPGPGTAANPCGPLGAFVADALLWAFGHGAWATFWVVVFAILGLAGRSLGVWYRWLTSVALFVGALTALDLLEVGGPGEVFPPGGVVGSSMADALVGVVGLAGAWLVLVTLFTAGVTLLARLDWRMVFTRVVDGLEAAAPHVRDAAVRAGRATFAALGAAGAMFFRAMAWLARGLGRLLAAMGMAAGNRTRQGAQGLSGLLQRMAESFMRTGGEDHGFVLLEEHDAPSVAALDQEELAAIERSLGTGAEPSVASASVEWDPTDAGERSDPIELFPSFLPRKSRIVEVPRTAPRAKAPIPPPLVPVPLDERPPPVPVRLDGPSDPMSAPEPASFLDEDSSPTSGDEDLPVPTSHGRVDAGAVVVHRVDDLEDTVEDDGRAIVRSSRVFELPRLDLLDVVPQQKAIFEPEELRALAVTVEESLESFKVTGKVTDIRVGPVVTTFEFLPDAGISVRKISSLADDLAMALCAHSVRIVAPIPGKGVVGIEIPSARRLTIYLRQLLASDEFRGAGMALPCVLGKSVEGKPVVADLAKMPHLLIGGTTGSGKSVGVNGMLMSLLFTRSPEELRLLLVDPKKLEFEQYRDIPHLLHPVVTEAPLASAALAWCCREMEDRYELLARWGTRNIRNYNGKVERELASWSDEKAWKYAPKDYDGLGPPPPPEKLPYIVIVIDELADLMMVAKKDVQDSVVRLAQMARACGMHLIVATQRPSVDVITGLIKSNLPTRIAFKLRSVIDSRTILDHGGAEKLLGGGDMLYLPGAGEVMRCHGAFVSDDEVGRVTDYLREQGEPSYIEGITAESGMDDEVIIEDIDPMYEQAVDVVLSAGKASTSMIQRHLKIGYNRAARIIDQMEMMGVVGPADGARPREVLMGPNA